MISYKTYTYNAEPGSYTLRVVYYMTVGGYQFGPPLFSLEEVFGAIGELKEQK